MMALILVLASSPVDPLWSLVDEERYEEAVRGALSLAQRSTDNPKLRQDALILGLTAACSGNSPRCLEMAKVITDWAPLWRPDSRALPRLVQAVGQARLSQADRLRALPSGDLSADRWCAPSQSVAVVMVDTTQGVNGLRRVSERCVSLASAQQGYLIAFDATLRVTAALGSPQAPAILRREQPADQRQLTLALSVGGVLVAGAVAYLLLSDPGTGTLALTVERRP